MKNKILALAISSALVALLLVPNTFADETTDVDVTVGSGSLSLSLNGSWDGTMAMSGSLTAGQSGTASWYSAGGTTSYLHVRDFDSTNDGFEISISAGNLTASGVDPIVTDGTTGLFAKMAPAFKGEATIANRTTTVAIDEGKSGDCAVTTSLNSELTSSFQGLNTSLDVVAATANYDECTSQVYAEVEAVKVDVDENVQKANYSGTITFGVATTDS